MAGRARQGLPIPPPPSAPPRPTKWQSIKLFVSVWKENIMISAAFGLILFSPTIANWWENYRLYKLRRDVREMTSTGDFYSRVPGWVNHEDLLNWNRENDPAILRKVQARNERLGRSASGSEDEQQR